MLELKFRCDVCGWETTNPTQMHVCSSCERRLCEQCRDAHEDAHRSGS